MRLVSGRSFFLLCILLTAATGFCQQKNQVLKSWIQREMYILPDNTKIADTVYTRYSFQKGKVFISFYPGWNDYEMQWSLSGKQLTIGPTAYTIDALTDSTMTLSAAGFRRIVFEEESCLSRKDMPKKVSAYNNEPLYLADRYITPRYKKMGLQDLIRQNLGDYNIRKATTVMVSFIVKKDGGLDSVKVLHGISEGYDLELVNGIKKSSKDWAPAIYRGESVPVLMLYTIKYLNSIVK